VRAAARELGLVEIEREARDELGGAFQKGTPLGNVSASWTVTPEAVEVRILEKPAFLPRATVTRLLEDGLVNALATE